MMKYEIQAIEELIGTKLENLPFLVKEYTWRNTTFIDTRTYTDDEGRKHIYPIGFSFHYVYVINPKTGQIAKHGICEDGNYPGHRSEGYILNDPGKNNPLSIDDYKLVKRFREMMKARAEKRERAKHRFPESKGIAK